MTPKELLENARTEVFMEFDEYEDGKSIPTGETGRLLLEPGLSPVEIDRFQGTLPGPLSREIRELLTFTQGFSIENISESVTFTGIPFYFAFLLPNALALLPDGSGNDWVVDVNPLSGAWGPVWYVCHDPPAVIYQCDDLSAFIHGLLNDFRAERKSPLFFTSEEKFDRYMSMKQLPRAASLRDAEDPVLRDFAGTYCTESDRIADLRERRVFSGFEWRRYHANRPIVRHPEELIFGLPERRGIWARLLGG
jgi:SMI1 / KNR4 family (SUKH-1)